MALALGWLFGVWPPPLWWRDHWPHETAMMREAERAGTTARPGAHRPALRPTPLRELSPLLERMVVIGEDSRFRMHRGIDPAEIGDALGLDHGRGFWATLAAAWHHRDQLRGASTITQQLAKNLYLSSSRSPLRKLKEAVTALQLERALPKNRILELYLNLVEWGPGIWGADAASRFYFGIPPAQLDETQAAALAATLSHPLTSNPAFQPERTLARRDLILARYHGAQVRIPPEEEPDTLPPAAPQASPASPAPPTDSVANPQSTAERQDAAPDSAAAARDSLP
ncbi:MAG TPA: biosynthetic peptidoglycan transglycosylase [Gemmatimonadales bacterium]|nr:biosynthetic peptidoglycan transglycosylase [Gemmatimonadales bacterium]